MSRRTALLHLFPPLLILLAGVGAYSAWGGVLKRRYHERLDALRASGALVAWADLFEPPVPEADNGAATLLEAKSILDDLERELREEDGLGPDDLGYVPTWDEDEPWDDEDRALVVEALERMQPYFAKLEEALRHRVLEQPKESPLGDDLWGAIWRALLCWDLQARMDPGRRAASLDRMFDLLDRRLDRGAAFPFNTLGWLEAVSWLREALLGGTLPDEDLLGRWGPILARQTARVPASIAQERRAALASGVWLVESWAAGRNPFGELAGQLDGFAWDTGLEYLLQDDEETRTFLESMRRLDRSLRSPPWFTRWWARPLLWKAAGDDLAAYEAQQRVDLSTLAAVRAWLAQHEADPPASAAWQRANPARLLMKQAACLHLARLALAVHDFARANGRAPGSLAELAPSLGGSLPEDPLTGGPFRYEAHDGEVILQTAPDGALIRLLLRSEDASEADLLEAMEEGLLRWRLPVP